MSKKKIHGKSVYYCGVCGKLLAKPCKHWKDMSKPDSTKDKPLTSEERIGYLTKWKDLMVWEFALGGAEKRKHEQAYQQIKRLVEMQEDDKSQVFDNEREQKPTVSKDIKKLAIVPKEVLRKYTGKIWLVESPIKQRRLIKELLEEVGYTTKQKLVSQEWIAKQVMEHVKPGKHTSKEDYKTSIFQWCAIVHEIFTKVGVGVIDNKNRSQDG